MEITKSTVYKRLFATNIVVTIFLITTLDFYFVNKFLEHNREVKSYINEKVVYDVNDEINKINNSSELIIKNMYSDLSVVEDILRFMESDTISYIKDKLDRLSEGSSNYYNGAERFVKNSFNLNYNLEEISFVSYSRMERSSFNRKNQIKVTSAYKEDIPIEERGNGIYSDKNTLRFIREVRDPINLKSEGLIILTYNLNNVKDIVKKYDGEHQVIILDNEGYIIYNSDGEYDYEKYEYYDEIIKSDGEVKLDKNYYINKSMNSSAIISVAKMEKSDVNKISKGLIRSIFFVDTLVLLISLSILYIKLKLLSDRTDNILVAMEKVKNGNLDIEIPITSDNDEINYISENFNLMCKDLNEYIKKIYLAEIEQKKAEMIALQNQINPHFLYNTLESIRMKAICNGDREVGNMLYTLSFLFRKQVKDSNIITLKDELDYCSKYIEIFKFRYYDNFNFEINCPKDVERYKIVKFSIQPLIENYFVHGIRFEDNDNLLKIDVTKEEDVIFIKIIDNGKGISNEDLEKIKDKLLNNKQEGNSIGIVNVNKRIVNEYGEGYGLQIIRNEDCGVTLIVKILCKEV
ncbi:histidine kinase [Clostridium sp. AL.422]|uniref:sensor histidine kinase n=1 Tax=Clostridium TaxID=1485 RepID=UPI00293DAF8A|nr:MULTISPECIES: histidine kinase [unclassified Clostridium]MDV4150714.1 histidine kinase [Clostridium sp. AL.422]